jgi:hypothetical protein
LPSASAAAAVLTEAAPRPVLLAQFTSGRDHPSPVSGGHWANEHWGPHQPAAAAECAVGRTAGGMFLPLIASQPAGARRQAEGDAGIADAARSEEREGVCRDAGENGAPLRRPGQAEASKGVEPRKAPASLRGEDHPQMVAHGSGFARHDARHPSGRDGWHDARRGPQVASETGHRPIPQAAVAGGCLARRGAGTVAASTHSCG